MKKLTVIKCTLSSKGGYILKLQSKEATKTIETAFGTTTQAGQETYYMKVNGAQPVGKEAELDITQFKVTPLPFTIPASPAVGTPGQPDYKEATGEEIVQLKWLFL